MSQAIVTTFYGPTNTLGSRIIARCNAGSITHHYDHGFNVERNHHIAAEKLVRKLGWTPHEGAAFAGHWVAGGLPNGKGNCYVLASLDSDWRDGFSVEA